MTTSRSPKRSVSSRRMRTSRPAEAATSFDGILALAATINALHLEMVTASAPMVQHLILTRCQDVQQIEQTLDRLLDCACVPEGLALFRSLCRYYYGINPAATACYVHAYRDMWDNEADQEQEAAQ